MIGVDFCHHVVRVACVRIWPDGRMALTDWRIIPISGDDRLSPDVFDALRSALDAMKANDRNAELRVGMEFRETVIHRFDLPKDARKHLDRSVRWAFQNKEDRDISGFVIDFLDIDASSSDAEDGQMPIILAAINRDEMRSLASRFQEIGHPPSGILLKAAASCGLMRHHLLPPGDGPVCELNIGMRSSRVNYFSPAADLLYSRRFNGGMASLVEAIEDGMERMGHPHSMPGSRRREAERIFFHFLDLSSPTASTPETIPPETILGWMVPVIHRMTWRMTRVVSHVIGGGDWRHVRLLVSGDIAANRRLLTLFEAAFEFPVQLWGVDPLGRGEMASRMEEGVPAPRPSERTSLASALGFALARQRSMNFLSTWEDQWREQRRKRFHLLLTLVMTACLAGAGGWWGYAEWRVRRQSSEISDLRERLAKIVMERKVLLDVSQINLMFKEVAAAREKAEDWSQRELPASLLWELELITPPAVRLTGFSMTRPTERAPSPKGRPGPVVYEVTLEGMVEGDASEAERNLIAYVDRINHSDLVAGTVTLAAQKSELRHALTRFSLRFSLGRKESP